MACLAIAGPAAKARVTAAPRILSFIMRSFRLLLREIRNGHLDRSFDFCSEQRLKYLRLLNAYRGWRSISIFLSEFHSAGRQFSTHRTP